MCESDGWLPIESAPQDGTPLLLFARCKKATAPIPVIGWGYQGEWVELAFAGNLPIGLVPSHWMPLPKGPNQ